MSRNKDMYPEDNGENYPSREEKVLGKKFDNDKLDWSLMPVGPLEDIIEILMMGAKKYAPNNWKFVDDAKRRYYNALMRHITAWHEGEKLDPESGKTHLAHVGCNIIFLLWLEKHNKDEKLFDAEDVVEKIKKLNKTESEI